MDGSIIMNRAVWKASGHEDTFSDPMVDCRSCKSRHRADQLPVKDGLKYCPNCGSRDLTEPRAFNLMFKSFAGPIESDENLVYLRPETAQAIFVQFKNVLETSRQRLPFGIAQIGKAFRNEINPRNYTFRSREFEQMEIEYFVKPPEVLKPGEPNDEEWHDRWIAERYDWHLKLGMRAENLRKYEQPREELAHYAKRTVDLQYRFFPDREDEEKQWDELEGIANRTDFDLKAHSKKPLDAEGKRLNPDSTTDLTYFDHESNQHVFPYVIEPSAGVDRKVLAFMMDAYTEEQVRDEKRVVLKLHPDLAPIKVAVLPLAKNKEGIVTLAKEIKSRLQRTGAMRAVYDDTAGIGKLYRRQDEVGTPLCVTVDHQSLEDNQVTIRDRDTMQQERAPIAEIEAIIGNKLGPG
jgi:glycyl-tRNA synthetase